MLRHCPLTAICSNTVQLGSDETTCGKEDFITFSSYRSVDNNSIVNDIEHILNVLDVSSLTAEDCTIWYNNFF